MEDRLAKLTTPHNTEDNEKKERLVHNFFFKEDYTNVLACKPSETDEKKYRALLVTQTKVIIFLSPFSLYSFVLLQLKSNSTKLQRMFV